MANSPPVIAHYRVTAKLGEGGMGEVYRATDTKLGRDVAIKLLPEAFAQDADRMLRFTREAQVLASLNHPNIAAIYGVEDRALVMELVEGPTLAERIEAGPVPLEEALPIARQMAEALEYAHERGIVHRDLKPANIKVTPEGRVKVLDFGLAKAMASEAAARDPEFSPTMTFGGTAAGVILGTAAYMSPEQARGKPVDKRADIWAFGVVLYEMLTGKRAFRGDTATDILASVLTRDLDLAGVQPRLRYAVERCLRKDPRTRWRDIGDVRVALEEAAAPASAQQGPAERPGRLRALPSVVAAALAALLAVLAAIHFRETPPAREPVRFTIAAPEKTAFGTWISLSPDGRKVAYTISGPDGLHVWVRPLDSLEARPLASTDGAITSFWSVDSRFVVFQSEGKLKKIEVSGGPAESLCDAPGVVLGGSWNRNGVILFGSNIGPISRVSSAGGIPSAVTALDASRLEVDHSDPFLLPDGRHFLYLRRSAAPHNSGVYLGSLDARPEQQSMQRIVQTEFSPAWAPSPDGGPTGHLLFIREGTLMAQAFDTRRLEPGGEPFPIADQIGTNISRAFFSVSDNGILAYRRTGGDTTEYSWLDREGRLLSRADITGLSEVALSPDGSRVAYSRRGEIWLADVSRGVNMRFSFNSLGGAAPVWSPDGKFVAFVSLQGALTNLYRKASNGAGNEELVFSSNSQKFSNDWSRDGRYLLFSSLNPKGKFALYALPDPGAGSLSGRQPIPVVESDFDINQGQFSPDSRWVAYSSTESGRPEIYVRPFPPSAERAGQWLVSNGGGVQPRWRRDGKELFYLANDQRLMSVEVTTGPEFRSGTPRPLFASTGAAVNVFRYDVSADGKRFLAMSPIAASGSVPIVVALNWMAGLKR